MRAAEREVFLKTLLEVGLAKDGVPVGLEKLFRSTGLTLLRDGEGRPLWNFSEVVL